MRWYQRLFRRARTEKQLDQELRFHLEQQIADYVAVGMSPEEARRRARLEFGGLDQVKEECCDVGAGRSVEALIQDLRYSLRQLRRNPGFTAVAVLTLALGIGANSAMFSVVNAVLLRPLPFHNPGRLVSIEGISAVKYNGFRNKVLGWQNWVSKARTLAGVAVYSTGGINIVGNQQPEHLPAAAVSTNFFHVLGVGAVRGRTFLPEEAIPGHSVIIISYDLWQGQLGGNRHIVGKRIELAGRPFTIIGVMPPGFEFPSSTQIWVPEVMNTVFTLFGEQGLANRQIARLRAGITPEEARSELLVFFRHVNQGHPASFNPKVSVTPLHLMLVKNIRPSLLVLMGAVGLVLLIACVNIANLLMTRNAARVHEMAIRSAIGANRRRLVRQVLTESALLALFGAGVGLLVAAGGVRLARGFIPADQIGAAGVGLEASVVMFTLAVAVLAGLLSGLLPAFGVSSVHPSEALKQTDGSGPALRWMRGFRLRGVLVSGEIALSLILLVSAALLIKSLAVLSEVNPGFRTNHLLCARLFLTEPGYSASGCRTAFFKQVIDRAKQLPGVREAAFVNSLPMGEGVFVAFSVGIEGSATPKPESSGKFALYFNASPEYFRAMEIPLLAGREFSEQDRAGATPVVIVSRTAARQYWPNQSPIGKRITLIAPPKWLTVVGVVANVREWSLTEKPWPAVYLPISQAPPRSAFLVLHASRPVPASDIGRAVQSVDRDEPVSYIRTGRELLARTTAEPRFRAIVLGIFALLSMLLACIGVYGVVSYLVTQRTHEIGVRVALGATKSDVLRLVVGQGIVSSLIGICVGIGGALALTRLFSTLLYGVKPTDPKTFAFGSLLIACAAFAACLLPAHRATKVDPMVALRHE